MDERQSLQPLQNIACLILPEQGTGGRVTWEKDCGGNAAYKTETVLVRQQIEVQELLVLEKPSRTPSDFDRCFFRGSRGMALAMLAETIG